jgi:LPS-assembly protein
VQQWQVLQGLDADGAIAPPYAREPQVGLRMHGEPLAGWGLKVDLETEFNRFRLPGVVLPAGFSALQGQRWHALATVSRPWRSGSGWLVPRLRLQTAHYETDRPMTDGRTSAALTVPAFSVDGGLQFERPLALLGRAVVQTLEPRLVYVNTPFREQANLPNFDAAPKDFNSISIFSDRAFSGIDRVADAHQATVGVSTRVLDAATGAELLRASAAQRLRLSDQQITPDNQPGTQRWSDLLLAATVGVIPNWSLDSVMQYNPERSGVTRSVLAARYGRSAAESVGVGYRYARDASEALELRWLWPLWRAGAPMPLSHPAKPPGGAGSAGGALTALGDSGCRWQVGSAGRLNYSLRDGRLADSLIGVEVDTGCWIGRVGVQRQSTGLTEAVTRLILQIELMGLSRSGGNPFAF